MERSDMYVKIEDKKTYGELVGIAIKSGWDKGHLPKWEEFEEKDYVLIFDEGNIDYCESQYVDEEYTDLKTAKRCLSRKIEKLESYLVIKLKNGVQVGCTPFDDDVIKSLIKQIKDYKSTSKVKTSYNYIEDGYIDLDNYNMSIEDLKQLIKDGPVLLERMKNSLDVDCESLHINEYGDVEYDNHTYPRDEVIKILKSFGYIK